MSHVRTLWFTTRSWEYINVLVCVCVRTWVTGRCITLCRSCLEVRGVSNWICKVKDFELASGGWQLMSGVQLWKGTREVSQPLFRECVSLSMCISDSMLWLRMTANYLTIQWTLLYMCHDASRHNWFTIKTVLSRRKTHTFCFTFVQYANFKISDYFLDDKLLH